MKHVVRLALAAVGVVIGVVAVVALREATLSTHEEVAPDSRIEVVVAGRVKGGEAGQTLAEMVEAQLYACRLEVNSDIVGEMCRLRVLGMRALLLGVLFAVVLAPVPALGAEPLTNLTPPTIGAAHSTAQWR